jgi:hypothetical protein
MSIELFHQLLIDRPPRIQKTVERLNFEKKSEKDV